LLERFDVEAPEVFSVSDSGLWDGSPSLGASGWRIPDVTDPETWIIRPTKTNGKFVIVGRCPPCETDLARPQAANVHQMLPPPLVSFC